MSYYRDFSDGTVEVLDRRNRNVWYKSWEPDEPNIWYWIAYDGFTRHKYMEHEVPPAVLMTALLLE